ncbi:MAG: HAD family phosphatase [Oscillospiraceae bacterium]|nr:HAD family phosphatase [Oscillospiraceae bacterium]
MKKKCAILDMDGCLVDTERWYIKAWGMAFKIKGIPIEEERIHSWTGKSAVYIDSQVREYTNNVEIAKELRHLRENVFWEFLDDGKVSLMPYAREILDFLKSKNLIVGLASSTNIEKGTRILKYFDVYDRFDFRVFGNMIKNPKPAPDIYEMAISLSKVAKEECIAFEDSASGILACNACKVDVIYVPGIGERVKSDAKIFKEVLSFKEAISFLASFL